MKGTPLRFALYLLRWQLSTPVLWLVIAALGAGLVPTIIANTIGGSIFFWVDRQLFTGKSSTDDQLHKPWSGPLDKPARALID